MRSLPSESDEAKAEIARAEEVAKILRRNIVQGEKVNQSEEEDRYRKSFFFSCLRGGFGVGGKFG